MVAGNQVRIAVAVAAVAVLSGCVSSSQDPVQLGLAEPLPPLDQPVHAVLSGNQAGAGYVEVSESDAQNQGPAVPTPSPRAIQTAALAQSSTRQNVQASGAATPSQPVPAETVVKPVPAANAETASTGGSTQDPANAEPATEKIAYASTEETGVAKQGFFQRLFQSGQAKTVNSEPARRLRGRGDDMGATTVAERTPRQVVATRPIRASVSGSLGNTSTITSSSAAARNNGGALPGVKSNAELFGVNDAEAEDESIGIQVASVGGFGRISPNGLRVQHEKVQVSCLKPELIRLINMVERHYGKKPVITSGYRSPKRNRRAGGARNSMHIFCKAADIQVEGVSKWKLAEFMRTLPGRGGVGTYCRTRSVHIDTGKRRDWHHPCRKSTLKRRKKA